MEKRQESAQLNRAEHSVFLRIKALQEPFERIAAPVLLFLWPLIGTLQGIDLTDSAYALGNYQYLGENGSTWYFATYLANRAGELLMSLPYGNTLAGMKLYSALILSVTALLCYFVLKRFMPGWMVFLGEWIALSVFWNPPVILYNTLSSAFLALACLFLFLGIASMPEKYGYFAAAGILLGLNLFVRFSNAVQVLLILPVWYQAAVTKQKSTRILPRTVFCVGGYAAGAALALLDVHLRYGAGRYFDMIRGLFFMTEGAEDYTAGGMLLSVLSAYAHTMRYAAVILACMFLGAIALALPVFRNMQTVVKAGFAAGMLVLARFFYGRGMFTLNYADYWCMFEWVMLFILLAYVFSAVSMTDALNGNSTERFLAALVFVLLLILPAGSNNYTFPILNNLFVIAPVTLWLFRRLAQRSLHRKPAFVWRAMTVGICAAVLFQGSLFHCMYSFRDGTDGTKRTAVSAVPKLARVKTTPERAALLDGLYAAGDLAGGDEKVIVFGNTPGLHYLFDLSPALSTLWADLDSYPDSDFSADLSALTEDPAVILAPEEMTKLEEAAGKLQEDPAAGTVLDRKRALLAEFLETRGYRTVLETGGYTVLKNK